MADGTSKAIQKAPTQTQSMASRVADEVQARLDEAVSRYHLVSPATTCGSLPEGCEVSISMVSIDPSKDAKETYQVGGYGASAQLGLSKVALEKIAAAACLSWDPNLTRRRDDGSNPHYCRFQAVGRYRHFDGQLVTVTAEKEMDMRDGSAQVEAMWERFHAERAKWEGGDRTWRNGDPKQPPKEPTAQIREMRLHIQAHAESKAKLRAIRSMGIKSSYTAGELKKPFAVARLQFTGRTTDPELHRQFSLMQASRMLDGMSALYGGTPQNGADGPPVPARALLAPTPPPPIGSTVPDSSPGFPAPPPERARDPQIIDAAYESSPGAVVDPATAPKPAAAPPAPAPAAAGGGGDGPVVPFGKNKGVRLADLSDNQVEGYIKMLTESVADPAKARFVRSNEEHLAMFQAEQRVRAGGNPEAEGGAPADPDNDGR